MTDSLSRKQNHVDSLVRKPFIRHIRRAGSKRLWIVLAEAKYDRQSQQEAKTGFIYMYSAPDKKG